MYSTMGIIAAVLASAAFAPWWPLQLGLAFLGSLVMVRGFVVFHDYMHGAILRDSWVAKIVLYFFGVLLLTPARTWRETHNFHHAHVGQIGGPTIGSFPVLTTEQWRKTGFWGRLWYRFNRHPLTIIFAYVTVFLLTMCIESFAKNPRKHWQSLVTLVMHFTILWAMWHFGSANIMFFGYLLPAIMASGIGAYLFYAQHNYPGTRIYMGEDWDYFQAALETSSYFKFGPVMNWFTGNIGYHHVHHLSSSVPFYRLPEAMAAIPELQTPAVTTLHPRDILGCFRSNLWDPMKQAMVSYRAAREEATDSMDSGLAA
ncbi:MAG: hypothetical protein JWO89_2930 [Verrucomicrobiaceae bacterium]|nr:hypothetical protein [Verrucomicrobiaceae bacterium]